jgi:hypothetical protein
MAIQITSVQIIAVILYFTTLKVFKNRIQKKVFGATKEKVTES